MRLLLYVDSASFNCKFEGLKNVPGRESKSPIAVTWAYSIRVVSDRRSGNHLASMLEGIGSP